MATRKVTSTVIREDQVTIPAEFRRTHHIREGSKVIFSSKKTGELTLKSVPNLEDLAGVDSGRMSYKDAVKKLDRVRENDRYVDQEQANG